jgi:hypothetical protein
VGPDTTTLAKPVVPPEWAPATAGQIIRKKIANPPRIISSKVPGRIFPYCLDEVQQVVNLVVGDGHDVIAADRQHVTARAVGRDIADRELRHRQRFALGIDDDNHLRRSQAVGSQLHVKLELALHPRASQRGESLVDGVRPGRIGLVLVCCLRDRMNAVIEPGTGCIALEAMQGARVSDLDGTQFRDGGGKQHS